MGPQIKVGIRNVQWFLTKIIKEKTGDLKFRSEWTVFRFTQGPVSSGFTVVIQHIFWEIGKDYQFQYQYEVWSELAKGFSIYSTTYEKSPTIWWRKSHNSGMKNRNFTKKYTDRKTINSNNCAKFEVNWPRGSQFTVRHTKNRLQFDE